MVRGVVSCRDGNGEGQVDVCNVMMACLLLFTSAWRRPLWWIARMMTLKRGRNWN